MGAVCASAMWLTFKQHIDNPFAIQGSADELELYVAPSLTALPIGKRELERIGAEFVGTRFLVKAEPFVALLKAHGVW